LLKTNPSSKALCTVLFIKNKRCNPEGCNPLNYRMKVVFRVHDRRGEILKRRLNVFYF
jgi:hypothetical protein